MPKLIDDSVGTIGAIISSMLTEAQFQALNGSGWILADGRSLASTDKYRAVTGSTAVPDLRGMVLRGKNNGRTDGNQDPAGERTTGSLQADQVQGHYHDVYGDNSGAGSVYGGVSNVNSTAPSSGQTYGFKVRQAAQTIFSDGTNGTPRIGTETRMKNVTVNHFIRIN